MKMDSLPRRSLITPIKQCVFGRDHVTAAVIRPLSSWMCGID